MFCAALCYLGSEKNGQKRNGGADKHVQIYHLLYTDICLGIFVVIGSSISTTKDSLLNIIGSPVEFSLQIEIYRGLADFYFEKPEEVDYLNKCISPQKQ